MKPTTITTWATNSGATADPGDTVRGRGFQAGQKLPAKWLNWILNQNGAWLTYLRDLHNESEFLNKIYAWTGAHTFGGSVTTNALLTANDSVQLGPGGWVFASHMREKSRLIALDRIQWFGSGTAQLSHAEAEYGISCYGGLCQGTVYLNFPSAPIEIVRVRMLCKASAATSVKPGFTLQEVIPQWTAGSPSGATQASHGPYLASSGSGYRIVSTPIVAHGVYGYAYWRIQITAGDGATAFDRDSIIALEVTYRGYFPDDYV